jgi:hypothetical protein
MTQQARPDKRARRLPAAAASLLAVAISTSAMALPPAETHGESVRSIPDANQIRDWKPLDNQRVIVNVSATDTYLLTLKQQCYGLGWAQNISVTMSNNTIWAGFDAIKADGQQCPIDNISRVSPAQLLDLQSR